MYVCMCVCMYVCIYACMYGCMHVCMYACMYVCVYVCMYACVCMYVFGPDTCRGVRFCFLLTRGETCGREPFQGNFCSLASSSLSSSLSLSFAAIWVWAVFCICFFVRAVSPLLCPFTRSAKAVCHPLTGHLQFRLRFALCL